MSRWRYPFKTKAEAKKYLPEAKTETGKVHYVFPVHYSVTTYKIFESDKEFRKYLLGKHNKYLIVSN